MAADRYHEESLLGTGGMAEVWLAAGPLGPVAIKRLLPHAARTPSLAAAFEREGRLLQRIQHPNVIGIHEVVRDERGTSLVLEYVEGDDLRALIGQEVPLRIALRIIRDVLRALEAVHGLCDENGRPLGLIHRDLSPSNILVGVDGRVKLTDFGIARAARGTHATTGMNVKGTLAYVAPEQATGAPVDARTDLFGVGALLYEMLSGAPIYDDLDPRLALARARAGDVKSLDLARPGTPIAVVELTDRALAATPSDRFPNAAMMLADLERVAELTGGLATDEELVEWSRSPPANAEPPRSVSPSPAVTTSTQASGSRAPAIGATVLMLVVAGVLWFGVRTSRRNVPVVAAAPPPAEVAAVTPAVPSPEAEPMSEPTSQPPSRLADRQEVRSTEKRRTDRAHHPASEEHRPLPPSEPRVPSSKSSGAETAGEKSLVDIGSEPAFAYVSIDGVKVGATPLFGREVAPGVHRIEVFREGLGSKSFTIEVRPGDRISRVVKLP